MKESKQQKLWREQREAWLRKVSKARLIDAVIAAWNLMDNHGCVSGKGFTPNGDKLPREDYAVVFPNDISAQVIEKLVPNYWSK